MITILCEQSPAPGALVTRAKIVAYRIARQEGRTAVSLCESWFYYCIDQDEHMLDRLLPQTQHSLSTKSLGLS